MTATATVPRLRDSIPLLSALPARDRRVGADVYAHGRRRGTVEEATDAGATVRFDDASSHWYEWDRLTHEPAPPLRFTITREDISVGPEWTPWGVFGNRPDEGSDYLWGHFATHAEAVRYAANALRAEPVNA